MNEQEVIEGIRDQYRGMKDFPRDSLASSIEMLADDLYAKETHFIFELIQNAEDNEYEDDVPPTLRFRLGDIVLDGNSSPALIVQNNEKGFLEQHVRALCRVGKSTKKKSLGYIGEKGIGFKSVFKITNNPHIFSGGYQFALPKLDEETELGYIVPRWVDAFPEGLDRGWTSIVLPLDRAGSDVEQIASALQGIAPETILFLRKLRSIEIEVVTGEAYDIVIEKNAPKERLAELSYTKRNESSEESKQTRYWMYSEEFQKPNNVVSSKREGIDSREVSVAIPLEESSDSGSLFAYLPVYKSTGLPFLINADFLLVSSREGIHENEPWNHWLRDSIPAVYSAAILSCLKDTSIPMNERVNVYASVPLESHQEFLKPVVSKILQLLKSTDCVYSILNHALRKPSDSRTASRKFRGIFEHDELPPTLRVSPYLVLSEVEKYTTQLRAIGVRELDPGVILRCLRNTAWLSKMSYEWFVDLYEFLIYKKLELAKLESYAIVPVTIDGQPSGALSCVEKLPVYFPVEEGSEPEEIPDFCKKQARFATVDSRFLEVVSKHERGDEIRKWMAETLCVVPWSPAIYCDVTISSLEESYQTISKVDLLEATRFLVEHASKDVRLERLPILLSDDRIVSACSYHLLEWEDASGVRRPMESLVTPESFDAKTGWQHIWQGANDRKHFVSLHDDYGNYDAEFFCRIGASNYPHWEPIVYRRTNKDFRYEIEKDVFVQYSGKFPNEFSSETTLTSILVPEPVQPRNLCAQDTPQVAEALIKWIECNPDGLQDQKSGLEMSARNRHASGNVEYFDSPLLEILRSTSWIPTTQGLRKPDQCFVRKQYIEEILGDTVPYINQNLSTATLELLEIQEELTNDKLIQILLSNSGQENVYPEMPCRIYEVLESRSGHGGLGLRDRFANDKLLYIPDKSGFGSWHDLDRCYWKDSSAVLGDDYIFLERHYPKLHKFFVKVLQVQEDVNPESYAKRWIGIQDEYSIKNTKDYSIVETLYRELLPIARMEDSQRPDWWGRFATKAKIFTQSGRFESVGETVVPDDGELRKIFAEASGLYFAWRPEKDAFSHWEPLYKALDVPKLSLSVSTELADEVDCEESDENVFLTQNAVKMIASWIRERHATLYEDLLDKGAFERLLSARETIVGKPIEIRFTLRTDNLVKEEVAHYPTFWYEKNEENVLLLNPLKKTDEQKIIIAEHIAKSLLNNRAYRDLASWIELTLGASDTGRIQRHGWSVPQEIYQVTREIENAEPQSLERTDTKEGLNVKSPPHLTRNKEKDEKASILQAGDGEITLSSNDLKNGRSSETSDENAVDVDGDREVQSLNAAPDPGQIDSRDQEDLDVVKDRLSRLEEAFNRDGVKEFPEGDSNSGDEQSVKNVSRREEKLRKRYRGKFANEPTPDERRITTEHTLLERSDPSVRAALHQWYCKLPLL